jgi:putative addiction module component (TIGR02574 family)
VCFIILSGLRPFLAERIVPMSERGTQILKEALSLPPDERAALVEHLLASLDASARQHIDTLWGQEVEDRLDAFERGEIPTISAQDVFAAIRKQTP